MKSHWTDGFLKDLNRFFFKNRERVKMHSIIKKTYDFFLKLINIKLSEKKSPPPTFHLDRNETKIFGDKVRS